MPLAEHVSTYRSLMHMSLTRLGLRTSISPGSENRKKGRLRKSEAEGLISATHYASSTLKAFLIIGVITHFFRRLSLLLGTYFFVLHHNLSIISKAK